MAEFSRPWPGVTVGDAGPYSADNWYDVWGNIIQGSSAIGNAANENLGVFLQVGNQLEAAIVGATVTVDTGASLVDGLFHYNNASVSIPIPTPVTLGHSRIDRIVVRKNYQLAVSYTPTGAGPVVGPREARITVIRGVEAASPGIPGLTQSLTRTTYWDIPIATVEVDSGGNLTLTDLREYIPVWDTDNIADGAVTEIKHNQADTEYGDYHPLLRQATDAIQADSGGNARGDEAIDLQQSRTLVTNVASGEYGVIGGGIDNKASGIRSTVSGGNFNYATATGATIAGGGSGIASGGASSVLGGFDNTASGEYSSVLGGITNTAAGDYSVAAGRRALTGANDGVFVFADSEDANFTADRADQFKVRAKGGVHFVQNGAASAIPVLELEQDDPDEPFIEFDGTLAANQNNNISTVNGDGVVDGPKNFSASAGWTFVGMVRVAVNGTDYWMPYYSADTA